MSYLEIAKLYKRIYYLETMNNIKNENHYTYNINDFGITCINYMVIDKNYYYIKPKSSIFLDFSGYLISNGSANLDFRVNILDNNEEILYSIDKNVNLNGNFNFNMTVNTIDELLNIKLQFIILGKKDLFKLNQIYMSGYYFKNCVVYIRFNL